jgi:hypothetical protein
MAELEAPSFPTDGSSPVGTGSLESDLTLLAQHYSALQARKSGAKPRESPAQPQQQQQQGGNEQHHDHQLLPHRKHCAVVYRAGQKQVVRSYAVGAREELGRVIRLLRSVSELKL